MNLYYQIKSGDDFLIKKTKDLIFKNYHKPKHTIAASILTKSGSIYSGINIRGCATSICAEKVALANAIMAKVDDYESLVVILYDKEIGYKILPPCGDCRQFLIDYIPDIFVIIENDNRLLKIQAKNLLINPYISNR